MGELDSKKDVDIAANKDNTTSPNVVSGNSSTAVKAQEVGVMPVAKKSLQDDGREDQEPDKLVD